MVLIQKGYTLIEILIVVAMIGFLAAASSPFTLEWYNTAKVNESVGTLNEAYMRTKATALSNVNQVQGNQAASFLCINSNILYLYNTVPTTCGQTGHLWSASIPGTPVTSIKLNGTAWTTCIALNNQALPSSSTFSGNICPSNRNFNISRGETSLDVNLY